MLLLQYKPTAEHYIWLYFNIKKYYKRFALNNIFLSKIIINTWSNYEKV